MRIPKPTTIDYESEGIEGRPKYPPKPVSVSIKEWGKKPKFFAWGHVTGGNNCSFEDAKRAVQYAVANAKEGILCQNAKFDLEIAFDYMDVPFPSWDKIHDTMFLMYLLDPHARSLSLKPSAEMYLDWAPEEQDAVATWLIENQKQLKADGYLPADEPKINKNNFGKWICLCPASIVGPYANGDTDRTEALFRYAYPIIAEMGMLEAYDRERKLLPILLENERQGMFTDIRAMRRDLKLYRGHMDTADNWLRKELRSADLNIDSDKDLADVLDVQGIVTDWAYTATGQRSTSKANLTPAMFLGKRGQKVASVLGYRNRLATCLGTFMEPWLNQAEKSSGYIFTNWNQVRSTDAAGGGGKGTRTGRLSTNPNFQNIPKDFYDKGDGYIHPAFLGITELPFMRKYILGDEGQLFGHRDYNQQEYRILAHFEDGALLKGYNDNPRMDMHDFVKGEILRIAGLDLGRRIVKQLNFGVLYGMGLDKLAFRLDRSVEEARFIKAAQKKAIPGLGPLEKELKSLGRNGDFIRTWGGRCYYCEEPRMIDGRMRTFEYKLLNYLIQGSAADCTKEAVIRYHDAKKDGRFVVTVHDEINISAPKSAMKSELLILRDVMQSVEFDVPMISDAKMGRSWGELVSVKEAA